MCAWDRNRELIERVQRQRGVELQQEDFLPFSSL